VNPNTQLFKRAVLALSGSVAIALGVFLLDGPQVLPPAVWWFQPRSGPPGTEVRIVGGGFREPLLVTFGGTRAEFSLAGPLVIKARVPAGAADGPVAVTTPVGTFASTAPFLVEAGLLLGTVP
jgi:hypothetical protein